MPARLAILAVCALFGALGCGAATPSDVGRARAHADEGVCLDEPLEEARSEAGVRALADAERRLAPGGSAEVAVLARGQNAFVARMTIAPGAAVPEHRDVSEEVIVVLSGQGTVTIDGVASAVSAGDTIYMPADAAVSFQNGDAPMEALQVFAGPESAAKYERWDAAPAQAAEAEVPEPAPAP